MNTGFELAEFLLERRRMPLNSPFGLLTSLCYMKSCNGYDAYDSKCMETSSTSRLSPRGMLEPVFSHSLCRLPLMPELPRCLFYNFLWINSFDRATFDSTEWLPLVMKDASSDSTATLRCFALRAICKLLMSMFPSLSCSSCIAVTNLCDRPTSPRGIQI
jgi:hypothetical protein